MSVHQTLILGHPYSKNHLAKLLNEPNLNSVREGIYPCKDRKAIFLFVDLVKKEKADRFHFNDYFEENYFHWDSQPQQHIETTQINKIISGEYEVNLFVRVNQKLKSKTLPFMYCGRLQYAEYDKETTRPVHILFSSLDFDETNRALTSIYSWKPELIGKSTTNNDYHIKGDKKQRTLKKPNYTERAGLVISRVGQGYYRQEVLSKWNNSCAVTQLDVEGILIASHIVPWSKSSEEERLDPENGILLSPNLDALFDRHLISFDDNGSILINSKVSKAQQQLMNINENMKLVNVHEGMKKYLQIHRRQFDENN